jgi:hypothetical protein
MFKIFIGYDCRQPLGFNVLQYSIFSKASQPVSITPLVIEQLPIKRTGLTQFTYSRFLVPYLCNYQGHALFLDSDMLVNADIVELFNLMNSRYSVMVVKNKLQFEWPSLMLFNCDRCQKLTPEYVANSDGLFAWDWLMPQEIGELPAQWNHLVGYDAPNPNAKLIHFTRGMPCYPDTKECEFADTWKQAHRMANQIAPLEELLGHSIHAPS